MTDLTVVSASSTKLSAEPRNTCGIVIASTNSKFLLKTPTPPREVTPAASFRPTVGAEALKLDDCYSAVAPRLERDTALNFLPAAGGSTIAVERTELVR